MVHDPTVPKEWQEQIRALNQSAIVAITDTKGKITYVNPMFCELSEYSEGELIGKTHRLINSSHHPKDFFKKMWEKIAAGETWRGEIKNQAKSGRHYWVDTTIVPIKDEKDQVYQYIAIRYEITSRKNAEEQIEKDRKKLIESEKMASLGILSAGIAHELGSPLGAIRGRLEMLGEMLFQEDFQPEFANKSVNKMIGDIDRISKIIRGLKSFSRDGSQDEMKEFDLVELVDDILELSGQKFTKNQIELIRDIPKGPLWVLGRESEIGQIIVNLINNAFDAIRETDNPWLKTQILLENEKLILNIFDSGPGVPEELRNKIFDPFFTTKEVGKGTGLGLSICRSFAEGHGGTLAYQPQGSLSCFQLVLPAPGSLQS